MLQTYPYLEEEDVRQALAYSSSHADEIEAPLIL